VKQAMKKLNVKKLAAIGLGAALVGTALAPIATAQLNLQKSDLVSDAGKPIVQVVVGSNAAVSDVVWAGNIAARIAQLATVETPVTYNKSLAEGSSEGGTANPTNLSVDFTVGGEVVYAAGAAKTFTSSYLDSAASGTKELDANVLTNSQLSFLKNETVNYKYNGTDYSQTVKEQIKVTVDARFDYDNSKVFDLVGYIASTNYFDYNLSLSKGIPLRESPGSSTTFTDGTNDNVKIYFFGEPYIVFKASDSGSSTNLMLVKEAGRRTYNTGEQITGLKGKGAYAGQTLTIKVVNIAESSTGSTFEAHLELYDAEGNLIDTQTVAAGSFLDTIFTVDGDEVLGDSIYLENVYRNVEGNIGYITVLKGADTIQLYDGKGYPYNSSDTDPSDDPWLVQLDTNTVSLSSPNVPSIMNIIIKNNYQKWNVNNPIYGGDDALHSDKATQNAAYFLEGTPDGTAGKNFVKVVFDGFKNDQSLTTVKIGNGYLEYYDTSDYKHKVPFFYSLDSTQTSQGSFTLDDQTFYYRVNTTDTNFTLGGNDGNVLNGVTVGYVAGADLNLITDQGPFFNNTSGSTITKNVDINGVTYLCTFVSGIYNCQADGNFQISTVQFSQATDSDYIGSSNIYNTWYYDDANSIFDSGTLGLTGSGTNGKTFYYAYGAYESHNRLWLLLDGQVFSSPRYSAAVRFNGTDTDEDMADNVTYYRLDNVDWGNSGDTTYYVADFNVDTDNDGTYEARVFVQTSSTESDLSGEDILKLPNNNLSAYNVTVEYNDGSTTAPDLSSDTSVTTTMQKAYTDYGTKLDISDGETFIMTSPQNRLYTSISVVGSGATTTSTGYQCTAIAEGATCTTDSGTTVTVDKINYTPGTCTGAGGVTLDDVVVTVTPSTAVTVVPLTSDLVVTDQEAVSGAGRYIIVGGYKVNSLAVGVSEDLLTAAGDSVATQLASGDYLVAGYTAADTATAAKQFINALEALLG